MCRFWRVTAMTISRGFAFPRTRCSHCYKPHSCACSIQARKNVVTREYPSYGCLGLPEADYLRRLIQYLLAFPPLMR